MTFPKLNLSRLFGSRLFPDRSVNYAPETPTYLDTDESVIEELLNQIDLQSKEIETLRSQNETLQDEIKLLHERYKSEIQTLKSSLLQLQTRYAELQKENNELKIKLNLDSTNSHFPPSSNTPQGKAKQREKDQIKSTRRSSGKKPGGQPGHKGTTLKRVEKPDMVIAHEVCECGSCGTSLKNVAPENIQSRQSFDFIVKKVVTEHTIESKNCPNCKSVTRTSFPEWLKGDTQYGPSVKALISYLNVYQLVPYNRVCQLLKDVVGYEVSEGTVMNTIDEFDNKLIPFEKQVIENLLLSPVVHSDETSVGVNGKNYWLHTVSTDTLTYYFLHKSRGFKAIEEANILPRFEGTVVHDAFAMYFKDVLKHKHALCNQHHHRDLNCIIENYDQSWAEEMLDLLYRIKVAKAERIEQGFNSFDPEQIVLFEQEYDAILQLGFQQNPDPPASETKKKGRSKQTKAKNILDRFANSTKRSAILAFMYDFQVPFTNNQAEQDLRMIKGKLKISGGFRSEKGGKAFARIRGYFSTLIKGGRPLLQTTKEILEGQAHSP